MIEELIEHALYYVTLPEVVYWYRKKVLEELEEHSDDVLSYKYEQAFGDAEVVH
jgi:hypothetical protein